jgi:hypothetical protein
LPLNDEGLFSLKLGATFVIESMQIPGYNFMAARLTADPVEGSPLHDIGFQEGDVITRLGGTPVDTLDVGSVCQSGASLCCVKLYRSPLFSNVIPSIRLVKASQE